MISRWRAALARERAERPHIGSAAVVVLARNARWRVTLIRQRLGLLRDVLTVPLLRTSIRLLGETCEREERVGYALKRLGRTQPAFAAWARAVELGSGDLRITRDLAFYYHGRGWWDLEHQTLRQAIELQERLAERQGLDPRRRRLVSSRRFGTFGCSSFLDIIAKQQALDVGAPETVVLAREQDIANRPYFDLYRRFFAFVDDESEIARLEAEEALLLTEAHTWRAPDGRLLYFLDAWDEVEERWQREGRAPLLQLPEEDAAAGRARLRSLGVPDEDWFVVLHVREDPTDTVRNADLATYHRALERVVERGGWVVRIGEGHTAPLPRSDRVLDYSASPVRGPATDVFLLSQARFMIGTESGPLGVASTFGTPIVITNRLLCSRTGFRNGIFLTKLYRHGADGPYLRLEEALATGVGFLPLGPEQVAAHGFTVVDNTAEEIEEAVLEMLDVLESGPAYTAADDELQRRYRASQPPLAFPLTPGGGRMARGFLRRHEDLLSPLP